MNGLFSFHKKNKPSFEIKEENLDQLIMPEMTKERVVLIDNIQTGYDDPRWIEKSNSIKARDNYTCQLCHAFNPMQKDLLFIQQGEYETYHSYSADSSSYIIHVKDYDFTVIFNFYDGFHLAMPRLNVHHKIYYRNRDLWDYPDNCLVTLCENCHHYVHSLNGIGIPIVEENSLKQNTLIGKTEPTPFLHRLDHTDLGTFRPFSVVKENRWGYGLMGQELVDYERAKKEKKKWYDYQDVLDNNVVHIHYYNTFNDPLWNKYAPTEIKKVADLIIQDFIKNFLMFKCLKMNKE